MRAHVPLAWACARTTMCHLAAGAKAQLPSNTCPLTNVRPLEVPSEVKLVSSRPVFSLSSGRGARAIGCPALWIRVHVHRRWDLHVGANKHSRAEQVMAASSCGMEPHVYDLHMRRGAVSVRAATILRFTDASALCD